MIRPAISIEAMPLQLKLKTTIHHVAATRNKGWFARHLIDPAPLLKSRGLNA
jgi:hypothetical protein